MNTRLDIKRVKSMYWDEEYNIKQIAEKLGISFWSLYSFMNKNSIFRRPRSEANCLANKTKPQFKIRENLSIVDEKLKIAGIMLYWAEGTLKGNTVDFVNSNPEMIKMFLQFLRKICGVSEERLRVYLYGYAYHALEELKRYWYNVTQIPVSQFTKPYIREGNQNLSNRKLPYGLVHIRYNDKKLLETIKTWVRDYTTDFSKWAGTQAAKGDRLCKRSVLPKGKMEK